MVELLIVVGIVGALIALLVPAVQRARAAAIRMDCSNRLRQIGLGLHQYHDAKNALPPGTSDYSGAGGFPFLSWQARLLPYLEQAGLWAQTEAAYGLDQNFLDDPPHAAFGTVVVIFTCPADGRTRAPGRLHSGKRIAYTDYLGVEGTNQFRRDGILYLDSKTRLADVSDGTSCTLTVGERPPSADGVLGWWYAGWGQEKDGSCDTVLGVNELNSSIYGPGCPPGPYQFGPGAPTNQCDAFHFWSFHTGGANFLFADGAVHFMSVGAAPLMPALSTRNGAEPIGDFTNKRDPRSRPGGLRPLLCTRGPGRTAPARCFREQVALWEHFTETVPFFSGRSNWTAPSLLRAIAASMEKKQHTL